jgi:CheY-like chemotaxis protein
MVSPRVLSVGHCAADQWSLAGVLSQQFAAEVVTADTIEQALERMKGEAFDLVLINRIFDSDGESGIELIKRLKGEPAYSGTPVMLVSNYDDAQKQAVAAGAVPGFGKAELGEEQMLARLKPYLAPASFP